MEVNIKHQISTKDLPIVVEDKVKVNTKDLPKVEVNIRDHPRDNIREELHIKTKVLHIAAHRQLINTKALHTAAHRQRTKVQPTAVVHNLNKHAAIAATQLTATNKDLQTPAFPKSKLRQ